MIAVGSGGAARSTELGRDALDRPESATSSGGLSSTRAYDRLDRVPAVTDPDRGGALAGCTAAADPITMTATEAVGLHALLTTTPAGGPLPGQFTSPSVYDRAGRTVSTTRMPRL